MGTFKKISTIVLSLTAIIGMALGVARMKSSELFWIQNIEIQSSVDNPPIDDQTLIKLAAVPIGKVSLFALDLKGIEHRLLSKDSIRSVELQKKIPDTLVVSITYKEPKALMQTSHGTLVYIDAEGKSFGTVNLLRASDFPLLLGFSDQSLSKIREALYLINRWENSSLNLLSSISSLQWESERGLRVLALYSVLGSSSRVRTMIDLGQGIDTEIDEKLFRLLNVFRYLKRNAIPVRQMWVDNGKKIVVKTVHGS